MPLIDDISVVPYSTKKSMVTVLTLASWNVIQSIANQLVACGWDLDSSTPASIIISYPLGFPSSLGGSGTVGCGGNWIVITTSTATYRYCAYEPGQSPAPNGCFMFAYGGTGYASVVNLAAAISLSLAPYTATVTTPGGILTLTLTADVTGPFSNFDQIAADGRFGVTSGFTSGGGYTLSSVGTSPYTVSITSVFGAGFPQPELIQFTFSIGPSGMIGSVSYTIPAAVAQYYIVGNPYSFAVFDGITPDNSIAAFAPCIPAAEGFTGAYCVFIVGPSNLTYQLMWQGGPEGQPCTNSLDNYPVTFADSTRGPGVLVLRAGNQAALTLANQPIITAAYSFLSGSFSGAPSITGKLWDCVVTSQVLPIGSTLQYVMRDFVCIASQSGLSGATPASLLFCINDNGQPSAGLGNSGGSTNTGGAGPGGGSSPSNPSAPPGSGNGAVTGTCTDTSGGTTIEWSSGEQFSSSVVGQTIHIALPTGSVFPYVLDSVTNAIPVISSFINVTAISVPNSLSSSFDSAAFTIP